MFLRAKIRNKDGKEHRTWSVVENRRVSGSKTIQRQVLYLGEIGGGQQARWSRALEAFDEGTGQMTQIALYPEDRALPAELPEAMQVRLKDFELHRPRQWGACWLTLELWEQLQLDPFWQKRLLPSQPCCLSRRPGSLGRRLPSKAAVVRTFNSQTPIYQSVSLSQSVKSAKSG